MLRIPIFAAFSVLAAAIYVATSNWALDFPASSHPSAQTSLDFMKLHLLIVGANDEPLPPGSPVRAEIRDTLMADAAATTLKEARAVVPQSGQAAALAMALEVEVVPDGATVWVHVDADRDGRVSIGDFITMQSYPVARHVPEQTLNVTVRRVQ